MKHPLIIGVDFDGTIVKHEYPGIGGVVPGAIETMEACADYGAKLILWTMRSNQTLDDAIAFLDDHDVPIFAVNRNPEQEVWTSSPKAHCHVYIDDLAFGCPLVYPDYLGGQPYVDWSKVAPKLIAMAGMGGNYA